MNSKLIIKAAISAIAAVVTASAATSAFAAAPANPVLETEARQVGGFYEGSIKGLPGVLALNLISIAALSNTPDSGMNSVTWSVINAYQQKLMNNGKFGGVTTAILTPLFPSDEAIKAAYSGNNDTRPLWSQEEPAPAQVNEKTGRYQLVPSKQRLARADLARGIYRKVQADVRAANEFALIVDTMNYSKPLKNGRGAAEAEGQIDILWKDMGGAFSQRYPTPNFSENGAVMRCVGLMGFGGQRAAVVANGVAGKDDTDATCLIFRNISGTGTPTGIRVRDMSVFKATDDIKVAVVFVKSGAPIERQDSIPRDIGFTESVGISEVTVVASYLQVLDANTMTTLGPRIPLTSSNLVFLDAKQCELDVARQHSMPREVAASRCN
jgi:hypothetical protein